MALQTSGFLSRGSVVLAFGLDWFPLLGERPQGQAFALAARRRASHYVITSGDATSAGLLHARQGGRRKGRPCSAAAIFAALHPAGTVAAVLPLPDGRLWLVAVHEGAVMTRADQLHEASSDAHDTVNALREAHPGLILHDEGQEPGGLLDALFKAAADTGQLRRMPSFALRPMVTLLVASLLALAVLTLTPLRKVLPGLEQPAPVPPVDPVTAWREAVAASGLRHGVHGVAGLQAAVQSIHAVPVSVAGWLLAQVDCRPATGQWRCRANYRREGAADNQGFIDAALPDWSLSFDPMEGAMAAWAVAMPVQPLGDVRLQGVRSNEARLVSTLQALLPAFSEFRIEPPQALPVSVPLDADRHPIPRPAGIAAYQRRAIHLQAPLRSLSVLLPETMHMSWDRIVLQLVTVDQPSLRSSSLRVSLTGALYEIDDTLPADSASAARAAHRLQHDGRHAHG